MKEGQDNRATRKLSKKRSSDHNCTRESLNFPPSQLNNDAIASETGEKTIAEQLKSLRMAFGISSGRRRAH